MDKDDQVIISFRAPRQLRVEFRKALLDRDLTTEEVLRPAVEQFVADAQRSRP